MTQSDNEQRSQQQEFVRQGKMKRSPFWSDYYFFLKTYKKWWMLPLLFLLLAYGLVLVLGSTGAAPFIYTLF